MRVFATKVFVRFARKERLNSERLLDAISRAERGSIDADLGGHLIKQRVARPGGGRSGGTRTVIAHCSARRSVFLYGFTKSERDNINDQELDALKRLAKLYLGYSDQQIATAIDQMELAEVTCDDQKEG